MALKCSVNNRIPSILNLILNAGLNWIIVVVVKIRALELLMMGDKAHFYEFEFMISMFILTIPLQWYIDLLTRSSGIICKIGRTLDNNNKEIV